MRTAKKNTKNLKPNRLAIAISDTEKQKLENYAEKRDISMSELTRRILRDFFEKEGL